MNSQGITWSHLAALKPHRSTEVTCIHCGSLGRMWIHMDTWIRLASRGFARFDWPCLDSIGLDWAYLLNWVHLESLGFVFGLNGGRHLDSHGPDHRSQKGKGKASSGKRGPNVRRSAPLESAPTSTTSILLHHTFKLRSTMMQSFGASCAVGQNVPQQNM